LLKVTGKLAATFLMPLTRGGGNREGGLAGAWYGFYFGSDSEASVSMIIRLIPALILEDLSAVFCLAANRHRLAGNRQSPLPDQKH